MAVVQRLKHILSMNVPPPAPDPLSHSFRNNILSPSPSHENTSTTLSDNHESLNTVPAHSLFTAHTKEKMDGTKDESDRNGEIEFFDMHMVPIETKGGKDHAGDGDEESEMDVAQMDRQQRRNSPQIYFAQVGSASHSSDPPEEVLRDLTGYITRDEDYAIARGGFGEVWKCTYQADRGPIKVAVKSVLVYASDQAGEAMETKSKSIRRELITCARLNHGSIMPVYGYTYGFGQLMAIVSPWAENGNLTIYLQREHDLTVVRRFRLLRDIATGLQYLHANNVIHGDLTGSNVLIRADGTACLADFGLSLMYSEGTNIPVPTPPHGKLPWMAPELFGKENESPVGPNKHSDIYSFGGIMLQVLTSKIPYYYLREPAIMLCVHTGKKPERRHYPVLPDDYWHFINQCWSAAAHDRPSAEQLVEMIRHELKSLSEAPCVRPLGSHSSVHPEDILRDITEYITRDEDFPVARGGFGEIWKCTYRKDGGLIKVAVKSLLVYTSDQASETMEKKSKRIQRELRASARLHQENILPVYGYSYGFGRLMAIVTPWAENGNLTTYLERQATAFTMVRRFEILRDIATGLQYLHASNFIHGHLAASNVLIHGDGTACLADFGLSLVYSEVMGSSEASWTSTSQGDFRCIAPELFGDPEGGVAVRPTKYSDIYSFGGIMLQVLTGKLPYYYLRDPAVIMCIFNGRKPDRSRYPVIPNKYWDFLEQCWSAAHDRPSAERVVEMVRDELDLLTNSSVDV